MGDESGSGLTGFLSRLGSRRALESSPASPTVESAPPPGDALDWKHPVYGLPMHKKQGVDDYLATIPARQRHDALLDVRVWDV